LKRLKLEVYVWLPYICTFGVETLPRNTPVYTYEDLPYLTEAPGSNPGTS